MTRTEEIVGRLARIHDEDLAGTGAGPAARALLDEVTMAVPGAERARSRRFRTWRLTVGVAAVGTALVAAAAIGVGVPGGVPFVHPATKPVSAVLEIEHTGGKSYTVFVKDAFADPAQYAEEFRKAGLMVDLRVVPVSPSLERKLVAVSGGEPAPGSKAGDETEVFDYPGSCPPGDKADCPLGLRISTNGPQSAPIEVLLGRKAKPGEMYNDLGRGDATDKGEALEGVRVEGRTLGDVQQILREHGLSIGGYMRGVVDDGGGSGSTSEIAASQVHPGDRVAQVEARDDHSVIVTVGERPHETG